MRDGGWGLRGREAESCIQVLLWGGEEVAAWWVNKQNNEATPPGALESQTNESKDAPLENLKWSWDIRACTHPDVLNGRSDKPELGKRSKI